MRAGAGIAFILSCAVYALACSCAGPYAEFVLPSSGGKGTKATELVFDNSGKLSYTLEVNSNTSWRIRNSAGWLSFSSTSGTNVATVKATVSYNITGSSRTAEVYIVTDDVKEKSTLLTVTQPAAYLKLGSSALSFSKTGGTQSVALNSNTVWKAVSGSPDFNVTPGSGTGDASISIRASANATRRVKETGIILTYADSLSTVLTASIAAQDNAAPSMPEKTYPLQGATDVSRSCRFEWKPSTDPDGDVVSYLVRISDDLKEWDTLGVTKDTHIYPSTLIHSNSKIYWTVEATDSNYVGVTRSDTLSFTTGTNGVIPDGTIVKYMSSSKASPCKIVFMGDGFIDDDLMEGNSQYDKVLDLAIEDFFGVPPVKDYKDYFDVWKIYAVSQDRGWSTPSHINNTSFKVFWVGTGSTSMSCDANTVKKYAMTISEVSGDINKTLIVVISNVNEYAGTTMLWTSGLSIGLVPLCKAGLADDNPESFHSVLMHEALGHGFIHLADEYAYYDKTISQSSADTLKSYQRSGFYLNVTTSTDTATAPWNGFLGRADYPLVGFFEGGYYLKKGVWRSENRSMMIDNIHYLPAFCRYLAYKRIFETTGEDYSLESFMAQDKVRTPPSSSSASQVPASLGIDSYRDFKPLGHPVVFGD
jgi:hypothetical protein